MWAINQTISYLDVKYSRFVFACVRWCSVMLKPYAKIQNCCGEGSACVLCVCCVCIRHPVLSTLLQHHQYSVSVYLYTRPDWLLVVIVPLHVEHPTCTCWLCYVNVTTANRTDNTATDRAPFIFIYTFIFETQNIPRFSTPLLSSLL